MDSSLIYWAFGLTLFAGLSTGIGGLLTLFTRHTNEKWLSLSLGFSAGVMLYVSFWEIVPKAQEYLISDVGDWWGYFLTVCGFFGGIFLIAIIDRIIPQPENPHEMHHIEEIRNPPVSMRKKSLFRMGLLSALAIGIHNFPEGLATFMSVLTDFELGVAIAIAIAIHNIPEGIAVAIPIYYSTGNRKKSVWYSFLSGVAEPVGALLGYFILQPFFTDTLFGILFAGVAGIMVFISLDQLFPTAKVYGKHHAVMYGFIAGMMVMAVSLILL